MNESFERLYKRKNLSKEQRELVERAMERHKKYGFDFPKGWYVDLYKHACGHWEILQIPRKEDREDTKRHAREHMCTRCTCNIGKNFI